MSGSAQRTMTGVAVLALSLIACQAAPSGPAASQTPGLAASASSQPSIAPTASPKPLAMPRPTDLPVDGTCTESHICLGLLTAGRAYKTTNFLPHFTVSVPKAGWENLADEEGVFQLLTINPPGDVIAFFRDPKASGPVSGAVGSTVDDLAAWLVAHPLLAVTSPKPVTIGGLSGVSLDVRLAADATNQDPGCEVQVCLTFFKGLDATPPVEWAWDWGSAGTELQRLYLVTSNAGVVAIFVDSLDGTTFDAITRRADAIFATLRFE